MKFLITGGAGFIGSNIAEELVKTKKGDVVIFDNLSVGKKENIPQKCEFIKGDVRDIKQLRNVTKDIDMIFHEAAFVSIRGSFEKIIDDIETNCIGTFNVLKTASENNVKKVIFASSMAVYGEPKKLPVKEDYQLNPISPYGLSKVRGELYCKIFEEYFGIKTVVLRYFNTFGIKQKPSPYVGVITTFINQALEGKPLTIYGDGNQTRDFVWVNDVAHASVLAAISKESGIFNIGSGIETSINKVADAIINTVGGKKVYKPKPAGEINRIVANITKAKEKLGYRPTRNIIESIPKLINWWENELS